MTGLIIIYVALGWVWCYWNLQRFFDRLQKEYPTHPRQTIGWGEMPLFVLASFPIWPLIACATEVISQFVEEPIGTKPRPRSSKGQK